MKCVRPGVGFRGHISLVHGLHGYSCRVVQFYKSRWGGCAISLEKGSMLKERSVVNQVEEEHAEIRGLEKAGLLTIHQTQCKVGNPSTPLPDTISPYTQRKATDLGGASQLQLTSVSVCAAQVPLRCINRSLVGAWGQSRGC